MHVLKRWMVWSVLIALVSVPIQSWSRDQRPDSSLFDPASDSGRYLSIHDAQTFLQGRWSMGFYLNYARKPLVLRNITTAQDFDIVRDQLDATLVGAYGITDWVSVGAAIPATLWQTFFDPDAQRLSGGTAPQQTKTGLGDIRLEGKFRLLDIERYNVGISLIPHFIFPSGSKGSFISGERWTPGLTAAIEGNIHDRVWLSMNVGYQYVRHETQYFSGNANAIIKDLLRIGVGARVKVTDEWAFLGEALTETVAKNGFSVATQTPIEFLGGVQYVPQRVPALRGLAFSLAAGSGVTRGVGAPKAQVIFGVSYPTPKIVNLGKKERPHVKIVDKIVITQKIHFAFNSSEVRPVSYPILDDVAELLRSNTQIRRLQVEGHTDSVGGDAYNLRLSNNRAQTVVKYLVGKGIAASRLTAIGYGESRPIADNNTAEGRAKNRRTEFTILE